MSPPSAVGVVLFGLLALAGCASGLPGRPSHPAQPTVVVTSDPALESARTAFSAARATVLSDIGAVTAAATALDGIDGEASKGAFDPARRAQPAAVKDSAAATASLAKLDAALTAFDASTTSLAREAGNNELTPAQGAALRSLAAAAGNESAAASAFATGQRKGWGAYRQLVGAQALWITRAGAGYYPGSDNDQYDAARAGGAYVVLVNPFRLALSVERKALAAQSGNVTRARAATEAAVAAAGTAFR